MWKDLLILLPTPFADEVLLLFANQLREDLQKVKNYKSTPNKKEKDNNNSESNESTLNPSLDSNSSEKPKIKKERPPLPAISLAAKWAPTENHSVLHFLSIFSLLFPF
jgi:hypothetical protein